MEDFPHEIINRLANKLVCLAFVSVYSTCLEGETEDNVENMEEKYFVKMKFNLVELRVSRKRRKHQHKNTLTLLILSHVMRFFPESHIFIRKKIALEIIIFICQKKRQKKNKNSLIHGIRLKFLSCVKFTFNEVREFILN